MSAEQTAEILKVIASIPPDENPYTALATYLTSLLQPARTPAWLDAVLIVFSIMYCLHLFIAAGSITLMWVDRKVWVFKMNNAGIALINTRFIAVSTTTLYSGMMVWDLTWQIFIDHGKAEFRNKIALEGMRWCPIWFGAWCYAHGMLAQIMSSNMNHSTSLILGTKGGGGNPRKHVYIGIFNAALYVVPLVVFTSIIAAFTIAAINLNQTTNLVTTAVEALQEKASRWDPITFSVMKDIFPIILPLSATKMTLAKFTDAYRCGWVLWASYTISFIVLVTPIFIRHLFVLRSLMGAQSVPSMFLSNSKNSTRQFSEISNQKSSDVESRRNGQDAKVANSQSKQLSRQVVEEYRRLAICASSIIISATLLTPLVLWAALPNPLNLIKSDVFWTAQSIWGSIVWACGGFIYQSIVFRSVFLNARAVRDVRMNDQDPSANLTSRSPISPPRQATVVPQVASSIQLQNFPLEAPQIFNSQMMHSPSSARYFQW